MNLFLIEWSSQALHAIARELNSRGFHISYCTADTRAQGFTDFKKALPTLECYDTFDAIAGLRARHDSAADDVIKALTPHYEEVHTMMRRMDYGNVSEEQKKELFERYICHWVSVLDEYRPDAVVFSVMPHMVYDYVLYLVCRERGIRTLMYETARVNDRVLLFETIGEGSRAVRECVRRGEDTAMPDDMRAYYDAQRAHGGTDPFYMRDVGKSRMHRFIPIPRANSVARSIVRGTFFKKVVQYFKNTFSSQSRLTSLSADAPTGIALKLAIWRWTRLTRAYQKEYEVLQQKPDLEKHYVYAPLHYQPEKNTSPQGGAFVDQIKMVRTLSSSLPEGWVIYVKEHPTQWGAYSTHAFQGRWKGYYAELASIPGVVLIPADTSTHQMIARARAIATVTGTAGWEATLRGVPALVFGYPWYMDCPEILRVGSDESCADAFEKIKGGYTPDQKAVMRFMACVDQVSARGYAEDKYQKISNVADANNARAMASLLADALKR